MLPAWYSMEEFLSFDMNRKQRWHGRTYYSQIDLSRLYEFLCVAGDRGLRMFVYDGELHWSPGRPGWPRPVVARRKCDIAADVEPTWETIYPKPTCLLVIYMELLHTAHVRRIMEPIIARRAPPTCSSEEALALLNIEVAEWLSDAPLPECLRSCIMEYLLLADDWFERWVEIAAERGNKK